jgi:hypothetical protein
VSSTTRPGGDDPELAEGLVRFAELSEALLAGVAEALPRWVDRSVAARSAGVRVDADAVAAAGHEARDAVVPRLAELLAADPADQPVNPLAIVRPAVRFPTAVLADAGATPVERDAAAVAQFPDDVYDLVPASFAELDPELAELGMAWGAAKAWIHLRRRR